MARFTEYSDEELQAELESQREQMRDYKKSMKRNPYYNPSKGLNRLQELESEYDRRHPETAEVE